MTGEGSAYTIRWYDNGVLFNTTTTPTVTFTKSPGADTITATIYSTITDCNDSATSLFFIVDTSASGSGTGTGTGVKNVTLSQAHLYPNPATSSLTIAATDNINSIAITNLLGQTVYCNRFNAKEVKVDVADLSAGVYFVKINGCEVRKFVKE